ncbi:flagellar hook assembly protein FlgD [Bacillus sp. RG28]|uniref:Flagellar hook assembly protein FlgD n=1 Tax=Gottfriedia endophytica TaxID=2820819 RepID=A0A940NKP3_9BACI|nr:flagellar hook assembly protein FlgD [Gottfriedia endophytica]MBP0726235.1 flagellar hook assembly protein FlgD [Gottfriedia endophytica]
MNTITQALNALTTNDSKNAKKDGSALGKDDFLKLLITQMQNQDPLSPMQDKDYIAQLATFSSLEQMTNMNTSFNSFLSYMSSNILQYSELIGKKISYAELSADGTTHTFQNGVVQSVERKSDGFVLHLTNGKTTYPEYVSSILGNSDETPKVE